MNNKKKKAIKIVYMGLVLLSILSLGMHYFFGIPTPSTMRDIGVIGLGILLLVDNDK